MNIYEERAREFAKMLMNSEEWRDYAESYDIAMSSPDDAAAMDEFLALRAEYHNLVESVIGVIRDTTNVHGDAKKGGCCGSGGGCPSAGGCP